MVYGETLTRCIMGTVGCSLWISTCDRRYGSVYLSLCCSDLSLFKLIVDRHRVALYEIPSRYALRQKKEKNKQTKKLAMEINCISQRNIKISGST